MSTTLIIPGLHSSGEGHWQTWFEDKIPGTLRVIQNDWSTPDLTEWSSRVLKLIHRTPGRLYLVAHSFGVLASAVAAVQAPERIAGALFVAPADPRKFNVLDRVPRQSLPFSSAVVASTSDPWMSLSDAALWADHWGADLVNLGDAGHINSESGYGPWPEGLSLYDKLRRQSDFRRPSVLQEDLYLRPYRKPIPLKDRSGESTSHRFSQAKEGSRGQSDVLHIEFF